MGGDRYTTNIGPGTVIGARAQGPGAIAEGSVDVDSATPTATSSLRLHLEIRGADQEQVVDYLEYAVNKIEKGHLAGAKGPVVSNAMGPSLAWSAVPDDGRESPSAAWKMLSATAQNDVLVWLEAQARTQREDAVRLQTQGAGFAASGYLSAAMSIDALVKLARG